MTLLHLFAVVDHCPGKLELMASADKHAVVGRVEQTDAENIVVVEWDIDTFLVESMDIPEPACGIVEVQTVDVLPTALWEAEQAQSLWLALHLPLSTPLSFPPPPLLPKVVPSLPW